MSTNPINGFYQYPQVYAPPSNRPAPCCMPPVMPYQNPYAAYPQIPMNYYVPVPPFNPNPPNVPTIAGLMPAPPEYLKKSNPEIPMIAGGIGPAPPEYNKKVNIEENQKYTTQQN